MGAGQQSGGQSPSPSRLPSMGSVGDTSTYTGSPWNTAAPIAQLGGNFRGGQATPPGHSAAALDRAPDLSRFKLPDMGRAMSPTPTQTQTPPLLPSMGRIGDTSTYTGTPWNPNQPGTYGSGGRGGQAVPPGHSQAALDRAPDLSRFLTPSMGHRSPTGEADHWSQQLTSRYPGLNKFLGQGNGDWLSHLRNRYTNWQPNVDRRNAAMGPSETYSPQGGGAGQNRRSFSPRGANPITASGSVAGTQQSPTNATPSAVTAGASISGAHPDGAGVPTPQPSRPSGNAPTPSRPHGFSGGANSQAIIQALRSRLGR